MQQPSDQDAAGGGLRTAIVLETTEESCTVFSAGRQYDVSYAAVFPRPRTERVLPGHLVAIATAKNGAAVIVWRWFDAVVLDGFEESVRLWEPLHGVVAARPRDARRAYRPGSRAYLSAGLPGADWWVTGSAVVQAEEAEVDLDEVVRFFTELDLWAGLG